MAHLIIQGFKPNPNYSFQDVAAATFMSIATSAPELFVNIIGTFLTKSDMGIGTIVGSSIFNTLGVASVAGLFARRVSSLTTSIHV